MRASPEVLPPPAIVAARDWLLGQSYGRPLQFLIDRLAKEPIWKQLNKRHPVVPHSQLAVWSKIAALNGSDRDIATQEVFLRSVYIGSTKPETVTEASYKKIADSYRTQAERLRIEAKELEGARRRNRPTVAFSPAASRSVKAQALRLIQLQNQAEGYVGAIESAAAWCEAEADWMIKNIDCEDNLLVKRHRKGLPSARAYCILLAKVTRSLYGDVLYGTVAKIASVALDRTVTPQQVIDWTQGDKAS